MKISNEIKTAILGIFAILAFIFGYNYLKGTGVFSSTKVYKAEYDNVQNLMPASYVQLKGFNIGSVKDIYLSKEHPGKVTVEFQIDKKFSIPSDSKAHITSLDLMGTKAVELVLGNATTFLDKNSYIATDTLLGMMDEMKGMVKPVMSKADIALGSLDNTITSINSIIDNNTQQNMRSAVSSVNNSTAELNLFVKELAAQRTKIAQIVTAMNTFTTHMNTFSSNLNTNNQKINNIISNADKTTSNLAKTDIAGTMNELKETLDQLKATINKMNNGDGTMAKLLNDDKLYKNLNNTLSTTNNLLYDLSAHPSKYVNLSLFGGRKNKKDATPEIAPNSLEPSK